MYKIMVSGLWISDSETINEHIEPYYCPRFFYWENTFPSPHKSTDPETANDHGKRHWELPSTSHCCLNKFPKWKMFSTARAGVELLSLSVAHCIYQRNPHKYLPSHMFFLQCDHNISSSNNLFSPFESGWACKYNGNDAARFLMLSYEGY